MGHSRRRKVNKKKIRKNENENKFIDNDKYNEKIYFYHK